MSHNITSWKTLELSELRVPLDAVDVYGEGTVSARTGRVRVPLCEFGKIVGTLDDNGEDIVVSKIECQGERSGSAFEDVLLPALRESTGHLKARIVWEGGDSIEVLTVTDGEVSREDL